MTELELLNVDTKELCVRASQLPEDRIALELTGSAETPSMAALTATFRHLQARAREQKPVEVVVDLRKLDFMNSACFKTLVTWIGELRDADAGAQYRIRFVSDRNKHWQRRSLGTLQRFAPDLVSVAE
jgi:hypothetical protein